MKRVFTFALIIAAAGGAAFGLGGAETGASPGTVPPALPSAPSRIVVAGRAVVSIMDALLLFPGVQERIAGAGVTDQGMGDFYSVMDPSARAKKRFPNTAGAEEIASAKPDLVILKTYMKQPLGDALERLGIRVLYVDLESPDSFSRDIETLGAVLDRPERARQIISWYEERVREVRRAAAAAGAAAVAAAGQQPKVLVVQYSESGGAVSFTVPPASWIQPRMVETAGGRPVWTSAAGEGWSRVGMEQIAAWDPDYVLVVSYRKPAADVVKELAASPQWAGLRAVQSGGLLPFPADFYSWDQADTRWILGLQWLSAAIHKAPAGAPGILDAARQFYSDMYGMNGPAFDAAVLPRISGIGVVK